MSAQLKEKNETIIDSKSCNLLSSIIHKTNIIIETQDVPYEPADMVGHIIKLLLIIADESKKLQNVFFVSPLLSWENSAAQ